ncbi:MAG: flagellar hook-basal body complex protein FliE [bacterium]|nr:flagellar hook-basal body complex protein FliE [bacterium]
MTDINTANLISQMRTMAAQAEGISSVDSKSSFSLVFQQALDQVGNLNQSADLLKNRFEMGDPNVSLADTMIATQKANLGFEATVRVRNKVVQAYQDIMNMPV